MEDVLYEFVLGCNCVLLCFEILRIRTQDLTLQGVWLSLSF